MPAYHDTKIFTNGTLGSGTAGVKNIESLEMTVTQSIAKQASYPTSPFGGKFCMPAKGSKHRKEIINGPWANVYRLQTGIGGLRHNWIILLLVAIVALLICTVFLCCFKDFAGPAIFCGMGCSSVCFLILGIWLFIACFFDGSDETGGYQKTNPFWSIWTGGEAKLYSSISGFVFLLFGALICCMTMLSLRHIDEVVGIVHAAVSCISQNCCLWSWPFFWTGIYLAIVVLLFFFGLPVVMSLGYLDDEMVSINGKAAGGWLKVWKRNRWQTWAIWFYVLGCLWLLESLIQLGHYAVSHAVAEWYFTPAEVADGSENQLARAAMGQGKHVQVRVGGVDNNYNARKGIITETAAGKMLVVKVGKPGPGVARGPRERFVTKTPLRGFPTFTGALEALFHHLGTIAIGAIVIAVLRPFRMVGQFVSSFIARLTDHWGEEEEGGRRGRLGLISQFIDACMGRFSKLAFVQTLLGGFKYRLKPADFIGAAEESFQTMTQAGGSIAYLLGAFWIYEIFGTICVATLCGWLTLLICNYIPWFSDNTSDWYVEDKYSTVLFGAIIAGCIGFSFFMLINHTADTLLYCLAWNRKQRHLGFVHRVNKNDIIHPIAHGHHAYAPQELVPDLIPEHEVEDAWEDKLKAKGHAPVQMINNALQAGVQQGMQQTQRDIGSRYQQSGLHGTFTGSMMDKTLGLFV